MKGDKLTINDTNHVKIPFAIACKQASIWEMQMWVAPLQQTKWLCSWACSLLLECVTKNDPLCRLHLPCKDLMKLQQEKVKRTCRTALNINGLICFHKWKHSPFKSLWHSGKCFEYSNNSKKVKVKWTICVFATRTYQENLKLFIVSMVCITSVTNKHGMTQS